MTKVRGTSLSAMMRIPKTKFFDPIEKKVVVNRDVQVNESSSWDWKRSTEVVIEEKESSAPTNTPSMVDNKDEPRHARMRTMQDLYDSKSEVHLMSFGGC